MLLVLTTYFWKSLGCSALLVSAYYAFSQRTRLINQLHFWINYIFAVPPANSQQSTWPGEAWPSDTDSEVPYSNNPDTAGRPKTDK